MLATALVALCAFLLAGCGGPGWQRTQVAIEQPLAEIASQPLSDERFVGQHFRAPADNLAALELLLVVPEGAPRLPERPVSWELIDPTGQVARTGRIETAGMLHNTPLRLTFAPIPESAGRDFELRLRAPDAAQLALWASRQETILDGWQTVNGASQLNDLWFKAEVIATPLTLLAGIDQSAGRWWPAALWLPLLLFAPGICLLALLRPAAMETDAFALPIVSLGLSLALIPLVYLWLAPIGLKLNNDLAQGVVQASGLGALFLALRRWPAVHRWAEALGRALPGALLLLLLLLLAVISRLAAVEGLALPLWVDSVHHTMLVEMFLQQGLLPTTYRPFLPLDSFTYHFGFHAQAALLAEVARLKSHEAVLLWGQVVNVAVLPGLFLLARRLTRPLPGTGDRPAPGSVAAGLVAASIALVALMPAYFVTWGRYTQLLGLALLPIALDNALGWLWAAEQRDWRRLTIAALLGAGLVVTHYRVLIFYALALLAALVATALTDRAAIRRVTARLALLALAVTGASAPWLWRLLGEVVAPLAGAGQLVGGPESYNSVPTRFLTIDVTPWLLALALLGLGAAALHHHRATLWLLLWVALAALLANGTTLFGLPPFWLVNNESLVISYWLPTGLALGLGTGVGVAALRRRVPPLARGLLLAAGTLLLIGAAAYGAWWRADIVNAVTVLGTADDVEAASWVANNLPRDARLLINSRPWQGNLYVGSDGGYWLPMLAGRQTTLPPVHYFYADAATRDAINDLAQRIAATDNLDDPALRRELRERGVTHVYIGAQGGSLDVEKLRANPMLSEEYTRGRVHIFRLLPE